MCGEGWHASEADLTARAAEVVKVDIHRDPLRVAIVDNPRAGTRAGIVAGERAVAETALVILLAGHVLGNSVRNDFEVQGLVVSAKAANVEADLAVLGKLKRRLAVTAATIITPDRSREMQRACRKMVERERVREPDIGITDQLATSVRQLEV
jgi:hypothetical protein